MVLAQRLKNFQIRVGNTKPAGDMASNALCAEVPGQLPGGPTTIQCTGTVAGRYLVVQLKGADWLTVCEVQVEQGGGVITCKGLVMHAAYHASLSVQTFLTSGYVLTALLLHL